MATVALLGAFGSAHAQAPGAADRPLSQQEQKRRRLLEELGLKKADAPAPAVAPSVRTAPDTSDPRAPEPAPAPDEREPALRERPRASGPSFARTVHPAVMATCASCHRADGPAGKTHVVLTGDVRADHAALIRFVNVHDASASPLLAKANGALHAGGKLWSPGSAPYDQVLAWITRGAPLDRSSPPVESAAAPPVPVVVAAPVRAPIARPRPAGAPAIVEKAPEVSAAPAALASPFQAVHATLIAACATCHRGENARALSHFVLSGDVTADESVARGYVDLAAPERSPLVTKPLGEFHGGGKVLDAADPRHAALVAWAVAQVPPAEPNVESPPHQTALPPPPAPRTAAAPAPHAAHAGPPTGVALPFGLFLNGRFDLAYERRDFQTNPVADASRGALRSYHHFLFLSREGDGPCGVTLEALTQLFWEAHCRVPGLPGGLRATIAGGKILVPFGAEPLFHQSYGGLAGFDQVILPAVWSTEGLAAHLLFARGDAVVTDDLFVVRGYALGHADDVLDLRNDVSATDDVRLGWGNRLGAAWRGVSGWYSAFFNPLGVGRRLFMQAVDLTVARPRGVPVLGHFSFAAGLLHADVAGGGVGLDYYHFGSYLQVRYHPTDWLYVQYRQGLHTFDNRRALVLDNARLTVADGSTHNFGVVARHDGLSAGLFYFINLEKVDEVANDLLRLSVTYEF
jgi:cytochrome c553